MPRRRVAPEDRQRGIRACRPCKASKKRCDSAMPCAACIRRKCTSSCLYDLPAPRRLPPQQRPSPAGVSSISTTTVVNGGSGDSGGGGDRGDRSSGPPHWLSTEMAPPAASGEPGAVTPETAAQPADHTLLDSMSQAATLGSTWGDVHDAVGNEADAEESPRGRMMLDSKGEKFYFGTSAGVSFLQFLRQILLRHAGPCQFTSDNHHDLVLEVAIPDDSEPFQPALDPPQREVLVDNFLIGTAGILHVYSREQTLQIVQNLEDLDGLQASIGCLSIAIGAQCIVQNNDMSASERSRYFKRGQKLAFQGMLENISIDVVYAFLLMSFYLIGACRRNTAFLYIGIAARSAHALGLHALESSHHLSREEHSQRIRTWESLRVIDLMVASVLCRPAASLTNTGHHNDAVFRHAQNDHSARHLALYSSVHLCSILEEIVQHLDQKKGMSLGAAEQFLGRLQRWSNSLPAQLRKFSVQTPLLPAEHEVAIGNLSISCLYYFAVILVTRPALISNFLSQLGRGHAHSTTTTPATAPATAHGSSSSVDMRIRETAKLARVCVDAAVLMANLCRDALQAGIILDNMCMLKAWIFSASLILGFSEFVWVNESRFGIKEAFQAAVETMKRLVQPSRCPQAKRYANILNSLNDAVTHYHKKLANERHRNSSLYVSQILVIDRQSGSEAPSPPHASPTADRVPATTPESLPPDPGQLPSVERSDLVGGAGYSSGQGWFLEQQQPMVGSGMLLSAGDVLYEDWSRVSDVPLVDDGILVVDSFRMIFDDM